MKRSFFKSFFAAVLIAAFVTGCGSTGPTFTANPIQPNATLPTKKAPLTKAQQKGWETKDLITDTIPGMSVEKAYNELLKDKKKGTPVIVAVVDAGVDIEHEDLKNEIWINKKEIAGNNKDDDNNGYVDDIHGWNFLGKAVDENLEFVRILKKLKPKYEGKTENEVDADHKKEFELYKRAAEEYEKKYGKAERNSGYYKNIKKNLESARAQMAEKIGKEDFSLKELKAANADTPELKQSKSFLTQLMSNVGEDLDAAEDQLDEGIKYFGDQLKYNLNIDFEGRTVVGDDVDDITDTDYGDNNVDGPTTDKEDVMHGTHVAGIIAAQRNNGIGMNGIANNVKIMAVRAVPNGDEYDKDIALALRYAVDNGAKVINTSFGKYFSTHPDWVNDAIKYAAKHDVLIVNASGNEGLDLDENRVYPNDQWPGNETEISNNVLSIGALNYQYDKKLVASFSNYGKKNVDIFAPGVQIWSTVPNNKYKFLQGTSMASPEVAGVAAVIRSYYPKLSASQVKEVIMKSGITTDMEVIVGGDPNNVKPFNELSVSGRMVNLYNALIMASKM